MAEILAKSEAGARPARSRKGLCELAGLRTAHGGDGRIGPDIIGNLPPDSLRHQQLFFNLRAHEQG